jgi:hypothetical protein
MHRTRDRQCRHRQCKAAPLPPFALPHRDHKVQRSHQRQQRAWRRDTPRRHIGVHQHQRRPRNRQRQPHRQQANRACAFFAGREATARQHPSHCQRHPDAREIDQQQSRLQPHPRPSHRRSHRRRKQRKTQMPQHKLRAIRVKRRIQHPLNPRQVQPSVFREGMIAMDRQRRQRQSCYQAQREPAVFLEITEWLRAFRRTVKWGNDRRGQNRVLLPLACGLVSDSFVRAMTNAIRQPSSKLLHFIHRPWAYSSVASDVLEVRRSQLYMRLSARQRIVTLQ